MVDNLHTIIFSFVYLRVLEPLWHSIFATKAQRRHEVITKKNIANINHILEFSVKYLLCLNQSLALNFKKDFTLRPKLSKTAFATRIIRVIKFNFLIETKNNKNLWKLEHNPFLCKLFSTEEIGFELHLL